MMPSIRRRSFLSGAAALCFVSLAGCSRSGHNLEHAWPQFGFDAANTAATPNTHGPREQPRPDWVHTAGTYYRNSTQVLIADSVYANTGFDGVYALAPTDGTIRWHDPTDYKALTPALADGLVLSGGYGFRRVAANGGIAIAGHRLGYRNWQTDFMVYPESPPTIVDDVLVAGVGMAGRSRGGGRVLAIDLIDGRTRWSASVDSSVWGAPAVSNGVVYAAQRSMQDPEANAALYALDLQSGEQRWRRDLGEDPRFDPIDAPVTDGDHIYLSTGTGPLITFDTDSGEPVWELDPPGGVQGSPALADGILYVGDLDGTFHAVDAATGDSLWGAEVGKFYSGPTVGTDAVYAVTVEGTLVSWRPDGSERWRTRLDPPVKSSPVIANGRLYLGTGNGLLYSLG